MRIKNQKDFFGGLLFIAIGLAFAWGASAYEIGRAAHMGPGYFPLAVGVLLAALGAVIVFKSLVIETADGEPVGRWPWRPLFFITLANALVCVAAMASPESRPLETLALAALLALGCWAAFVKGLKLPWQVWPAFITG